MSPHVPHPVCGFDEFFEKRWWPGSSSGPSRRNRGRISVPREAEVLTVESTLMPTESPSRHDGRTGINLYESIRYV